MHMNTKEKSNATTNLRILFNRVNVTTLCINYIIIKSLTVPTFA
jgi:hypothetical protein